MKGLFGRTVTFISDGLGIARLRRARRQEALGLLDEATASYISAGRQAEAVRVLLQRVEATTRPEQALAFLARAAEHAAGEERRRLRLRLARMRSDLVQSGALLLPQAELRALAGELEDLGEPEHAARIFAAAGDLNGQTSALIAAGDIERLEHVLSSEQLRVREHRRREALQHEVRQLDAAGQRRAALRLASEGGKSDPRLEELVCEVDARRVRTPTVHLSSRGETFEVAFGRVINIGRTEATVCVPAPSISREHLVLRRGQRGPEIADAGSRNGTTLAGARLDVPIEIGAGVDLVLGGDVSLRLWPWRDGVKLELLGRSLFAPLGPLVLEAWAVERGQDGWLELSSGESSATFLNGLCVAPPLELGRGDQVSDVRHAEAILRILG